MLFEILGKNMAVIFFHSKIYIAFFTTSYFPYSKIWCQIGRHNSVRWWLFFISFWLQEEITHSMQFHASGVFINAVTSIQSDLSPLLPKGKFSFISQDSAQNHLLCPPFPSWTLTYLPLTRTFLLFVIMPLFPMWLNFSNWPCK